MLSYNLKYLIIVGLLALNANSAIAVDRLIEPEKLKNTDLEIKWETKFPVGKNEELKTLTALGNRLYAFSTEGYAVAMSRSGGNIIWSRYLSRDSLPVVGFDSYGNNIYSIIGNELVELNPEFGTEKSRFRLPFGVACPAARNEDYYYICAHDNRLKVFKVKSKVKIMEVTADDDSMLTSVYADEEAVIFSTDSGYVVRIKKSEPVRIWQFKAAGKVVHPLVEKDESVYFASQDTNVYRLSKKTGELIWKYQTNALLGVSPLVTETAVYQTVNGKGLTALQRETGQRIWKLDNGLSLLAEKNQKAYVITEKGDLVIVDNDKKEVVKKIDLENIAIFHSNPDGDEIYLADKAGRIAVLTIE